MRRENQKSTFLILVFGLPASGKSTFASSLKSSLPSAIHICADRIESIFHQEDIMIPEEKEQILALLLQTEKKEYERVDFDAEKWKQSRRFIEKAVEMLISHHPIIIEDDLLYKSQRKPFRKVSFLHEIPYIELLMDSSAEECLENLQKRNSVQSSRIVTPEVILKAKQKLQVSGSDPYVKSLPQCLRMKTVGEQILPLLQIVHITPNDPNDPNDPNRSYLGEKSQHEHSLNERIEIEVRRVINWVMNKEGDELEQIFGKDMTVDKKLNEKKCLSKLLASWKKEYVKKKDKSPCASEMMRDLKQRLGVIE